MKPPKLDPTSKSRTTKDTSTKVETFRPPNDIEYGPDMGSSLREVTKQSRGDTADERSLQDIAKHDHDGVNSKRISFFDLLGLVKTVTAAPTWKPTCFAEQIAFYYSGGVPRIYFYDTKNQAWRFIA